ncbi:hypothetical protein [Hahella sp. HN01]|uniref:hypothetical protein n=1 Tax=Hahella sp. HN01 TaxID=2847262 RepID=UPI001C1EDCDB|nr:hypothetical protein [Hahella sp. HN01]MBU6953518.1 hypothetical protein [Hahella sp. HN01]
MKWMFRILSAVWALFVLLVILAVVYPSMFPQELPLPLAFIKSTLSSAVSSPVYFALPVFIFAIFTWPLMLLFMGARSGWKALAERYQYSANNVATRFIGPNSGMIGKMSYKNILFVGADEQYLYLKTLFLFRLGNPTLAIPWSDISAIKSTTSLLPAGAPQFLRAISPSGRFASVTLSTMPEQRLTLPWDDSFTRFASNLNVSHSEQA